VDLFLYIYSQKERKIIIFKVENINFCYGNNSILNNISFNIKEKEYVTLIGKNGSGKTTLFNIIGGFFKPLSGKVTFLNRDIFKMPVSERAKHIAFVGQHQSYSFPFKCQDVIKMGFYPNKSRFQKLSDYDLNKLENMMILTDTIKLKDKLITQISGGELQRVVLARAIIQNTKLILIDEAMSELDLYSKIKMIKLLKKIVAENNVSVFSISHDLNLSYRFSDRILAIDGGRIILNGLPSNVFNEKFFNSVFKVKALFYDEKGFVIYDNV